MRLFAENTVLTIKETVFIFKQALFYNLLMNDSISKVYLRLLQLFSHFRTSILFFFVILDYFKHLAFVILVDTSK